MEKNKAFRLRSNMQFFARDLVDASSVLSRYFYEIGEGIRKGKDSPSIVLNGMVQIFVDDEEYGAPLKKYRVKYRHNDETISVSITARNIMSAMLLLRKGDICPVPSIISIKETVK